jgi:thioredoxin reductase (NADPH)
MILADELAPLPIFADLDAETLARVAHHAADVRARDGEYLVHEGEICNFYVLLSGRLELTKRLANIERIVGIRETPGDYFGEVPLMLGTVTICNLRAIAPSRLMSIEAQEFRHLFRSAPAFAARVAASSQERLAGIQEMAAEQREAAAIVVGREHDRACHDVRDFLARNHISFEYLDIGDPLAARSIPHFERYANSCPLVKVDDGPVLVEPTMRELADAFGLPTKPRAPLYDVAIVGGGPAGLAAAVYGASEGLRTILFEREAPGGQAGTSSRIENYLGFPTGLSGDDLASRAIEQATRFGAELVVTRCVTGIAPSTGGAHRVEFDGDEHVDARAVVLANGVAWRNLAVGGIDRFVGAGVYYGAARTEAMAVAGHDIYLIGAGNSAGQAAMFFSAYARTVTLVVRGPSLAKSMSDYLIKQLATRDNVEYALNSEIVAAYGTDHLQAIDIENRATGKRERHETTAVFVFIGADAKTDWLPPEILRDEHGYVLTGARMQSVAGATWSHGRDPFFLETSVPGIFAAGDVRATSVKRCAAGVGEGSMAIAFIHQFLEEEAALQSR